MAIDGVAGDLQKFGSHAGSAVPVVLIGPVLVAADNNARITDFGATGGPGAANGVYELQKSNDGFALDVRPISRIEMPVAGTSLKTWDSPPLIEGGESFRVIASQTTPGPMSAELMGQTKNANIVD